VSLCCCGCGATGHVARSGTLTSEIVEFEIKRAFEWLETKVERRHAAVLVLRELAENTPTLFNVHVPEFLQHIWVGLRDQREPVRDAAVEALRACLSLVETRASKMRSQWYNSIFVEVQSVRSDPTESCACETGPISVGSSILR
jgi:serine/threonine-protein kinase mTOR